jgi:hypothetical protein
MHDFWIRQAALERTATLLREAATERLAARALGRLPATSEPAARPQPLVTFRLAGRLWVRVELWPR